MTHLTGTPSSTSLSGLMAQYTRIDTLAENIANTETTRTPDGGPYRRKDVTFSAPPDGQGGVRVEIHADDAPFPVERDPTHPDADADGLVRKPNVSIPQELVGLMQATNAAQANLAAYRIAREAEDSALDLLA